MGWLNIGVAIFMSSINYQLMSISGRKIKGRVWLCADYLIMNGLTVCSCVQLLCGQSDGVIT